ncbi:hypothetical protein EME01_57270 [Sinorhizobium meliloti]|nr:hypothetical protein EME01_57270 [Sinorhizobium meliloti]
MGIRYTDPEPVQDKHRRKGVYDVPGLELVSKFRKATHAGIRWLPAWSDQTRLTSTSSVRVLRSYGLETVEVFHERREFGK